MQKFSGYEKAKEAAQYVPGERLPAGGYVCKILKVKLEKGENGNSDRIALQFDVVEGEYKDFFRKQYTSSTQENKKWKGSVRIYCPRDDCSEQDGWTKNAFARWVNGFETSNNGYRWDWDETKWENKLVGIVFGDTGTVIEGREVVYTEARTADSVDNIRSGKFREQKFKSRNGYTGKGNSGSGISAKNGDPNEFMNLPDTDDEEIPF